MLQTFKPPAQILDPPAPVKLTIRHATTYRYARPVSFGEHRLMLRPRDSHDLRLVHAELTLSPPGQIRWMHDVFGNSVAIVSFIEKAPLLSIISTLKLERYSTGGPAFPIAPEAEQYPFIYSAEDRADLGRLLDQHYPDPDGVLAKWADGFVTSRPMGTFALLSSLNAALKPMITYQERHEEGTQTPAETLTKKVGACRDFATLFIEAARHLGFGARFISGYFYDPALDKEGQPPAPGATHAWAEIFIPGAGWIEFDPTDVLIATDNLIRVAVTRDSYQAIPITGSYVGAPSDFLGMEVAVTVTAR
ncbi:MAG: transglutaminase family protein [Pseudolabrys sp.]|nr:transglutaminase family protein [Pseudolabrys sp.]MBV9262223.1 transglutaminase family protein [Pseudolabrys sp.]